MDDQRWRRLEDLYHAARSLPAVARAEFLADECRGDESLRSEVESLLGQPDHTWVPAERGTRQDAPHLTMVGRRIGGYQINALIGAGGMGEVYRARDTRLGRDVAIKILPRAFASEPERMARFEREAQAVAALNHPHIVTIYSVEQADGQFFLTMELVEGRSLAEALPKGGLPLDRLLQIAIPVAEAMAAAHHKGITHRDLKPANIMLGEGEQDGRVKVLDFGLAKLADAPLSAGLTALPTAPITGEGRILGTVAYMSPEQAEGKPIDARSDLFSLGVILYEMATGVRPFTGDTSMSIISSILKDTPKPITDLNPGLPRDLGRIIRRALAKTSIGGTRPPKTCATISRS